ncbi:GNAT family N-acetyltransferase [Sphingomonas sp.]|uniref:GNAT family N-acetyltransferase n=1 Tax=Sphingomonas sp. TaxID=28214 RepID=UPI003B00FB5C
MALFETDRLTVKRIGEEDAGFALAMLNDPGFLTNIGDRGVRTIADARRYVTERVLASYAAHGYGMFLVSLRGEGEPIGMIGLVRRDGLDGPDLGFSLLERHTRRGYGLEAARAMLDATRAIRPLLAIARPENAASAALLARLRFVERGRVALPGQDGESRLFVLP